MRSFSLTQRNIFAHPLRSVLTISAIALGVAMLLAASARCLVALVGFAPLSSTLPALSFLLLSCMIGEVLRTRHPAPGPRLRWLAALHATVFMACYCHMRCWFTREIHWRGISYRVRWGGRVEEIRETER